MRTIIRLLVPLTLLWALSSTALATVPIPSGAKATEGTYPDKVRVSWNKIPHFQYVNVDGITLHNFEKIIVKRGSTIVAEIDNRAATYFDVPTAPGQFNYFTVLTKSNNLLSAPSAQVMGFAGAPPAPTMPTMQIVNDHDYIRVSWEHNGNHQTLLRTPEFGGNPTRLHEIHGYQPKGFSYDDVSAKPGVTYGYRLLSCNAAKLCKSTKGQTYEGTRLGTYVPPGPITGFTVSKGTHSEHVKVHWDGAPGTTHGDRNYSVTRSDSKNNLANKKNFSTSNNVVLDKSAAPGKNYYYQVIGHDKYHWGSTPKSAWLEGWRKSASTTGTSMPVPGRPLRPVASDGKYAGRVTITWKAVIGAKSYTLYRGASRGRTKTKLTSTPGTSYTDRTARAGVTYRYWVQGCSGTKCGMSSPVDLGFAKKATRVVPKRVIKRAPRFKR